MGDLQLDFFKQDRLLIDGIPIKIKMIPARDVYTLMTKSGVTEEYSLKLVKTSLDICYYHIAPNIIQAHFITLHTALWSAFWLCLYSIT